MNKIKKEAEILAELMNPEMGIIAIMKKLEVSWADVNAVRIKNSEQLKARPDRVSKISRKIHIGARFDGVLTKKVLETCGELGINKNDFLVMVTKFYLDNINKLRRN